MSMRRGGGTTLLGCSNLLCATVHAHVTSAQDSAASDATFCATCVCTTCVCVGVQCVCACRVHVCGAETRSCGTARPLGSLPSGGGASRAYLAPLANGTRAHAHTHTDTKHAHRASHAHVGRRACVCVWNETARGGGGHEARKERTQKRRAQNTLSRACARVAREC